MVTCSICSSESKLFFKKKVLLKYDIKYFKCDKCGFLFTEKPFWLSEAYSDAITSTDIGLVKRNIYLADVTEEFVLTQNMEKQIHLDYAGGYGLFVRIMRDKGFHFYRYDPYCNNLFAQGADLNQQNLIGKKFGMLTAFEVFEHLVNPEVEVGKMLDLTDTVFFSTELQPKMMSADWWYLSPHTGQHVAFYTIDALEKLAQNLQAHFYTDGQSLHLFSKQKLKESPFVKKPFPLNVFHSMMLKKKKKALRSLLQNDHQNIVHKIAHQ